jgi:hypothetical protein
MIHVSCPRGCPSKISSELVSEVHLVTLEESYKGSQVLAVHLAQHLGIKISHGTINTIRKLLQFWYTSSRKCPVTTGKKQESKVTFCEHTLHGNIPGMETLSYQLSFDLAYMTTADECGFSAHIQRAEFQANFQAR